MGGGTRNDQLLGEGGNDALAGGADTDSANGGAGSPDTCTAETESVASVDVIALSSEYLSILEP
jgi:Ca2+-binding RTX toxin-like protein